MIRTCFKCKIHHLCILYQAVSDMISEVQSKMILGNIIDGPDVKLKLKLYRTIGNQCRNYQPVDEELHG